MGKFSKIWLAIVFISVDSQNLCWYDLDMVAHNFATYGQMTNLMPLKTVESWSVAKVLKLAPAMWEITLGQGSPFLGKDIPEATEKKGS